MHSAAIAWAFLVLAGQSLAEDKAVVISASQYFEGNDGPWSSFNLRVGTPPQDVRVLVSTASPETLVVLSEYGCSDKVFETVPPNCEKSRGALFNQNKSSSWKDIGTYGINQNGVGLEANLGYSQRADFGLESIAVGVTGVGLDNQTVAGIVTPEPFYLGAFGLNNQPQNFSTLSNTSKPSFISTLKSQKKIPSLSWSYTAGAKYRLKQVYGQLVFSGYDTSRFEDNSVTFHMADDVTRDLVVSLQSITYKGSSSGSLLSDSIFTFIDSTDPNIWLPEKACQAFEKAFGLTLDDKTGLYLVNDSLHDSLTKSNPEVSFKIADLEKTGGDTVTITLPYAAFDLTAEYPLVDDTTRYFPLKRASNSTQYTLGRTFLQEAYLSADYERMVFNVSANVWKEGAEQNIITITPKGSDSSTVGGASSSSSSTTKLSTGAIAGISVGCVAFGLIVIILAALFILRKRRKWLGKGFAHAGREPEPDEAVLQGPVLNSTPPPTLADSSSTPLSAGAMTGGRSTADHSGSSEKPVTISESAASGSAAELDGDDTHLKPKTELDGKEVHIGESGEKLRVPMAQNPGVYELPGSEVAGARKDGDG